jgi:hypothetical protein
MIKRKILLTLFFVFLGGVMLLTSTPQEQPPLEGRELGEHRDSPGPHEDNDHWVGQLQNAFLLADKNLFEAEFILGKKDKIFLSAEQEQKVETIMMAYQETCIRIGAEIKIRELRLASAIRSEHLNKTQMANYIREISGQKTDWVVKYFNYLLDLRELLSKKQLEILGSFTREKKHALAEQGLNRAG